MNEAAPVPTPDAHTPGPWRVTRHSPSLVKVESADRVICDGFSNEEANARLIAAAPDLLKYLKEGIGQAEKGRSIEDWLNDARAAILKATQP